MTLAGLAPGRFSRFCSPGGDEQNLLNRPLGRGEALQACLQPGSGLPGQAGQGAHEKTSLKIKPRSRFSRRSELLSVTLQLRFGVWSELRSVTLQLRLVVLRDRLNYSELLSVTLQLRLGAFVTV